MAHYGVLGMHWGIRRYQNEDGSLKEAGKIRYSKRDQRALDALDKDYHSFDTMLDGYKDKHGRTLLTKEDVAAFRKAIRERQRKIKSKYTKEAVAKKSDDTAKKAIDKALSYNQNIRVNEAIRNYYNPDDHKNILKIMEKHNNNLQDIMNETYERR